MAIADRASAPSDPHPAAPLVPGTQLGVRDVAGGKVAIAAVDPIHWISVDRGIVLRAAAAAVSARLARVMTRLT